MERKEMIERYCKLASEVWNAVGDSLNPNDCFCGTGGFWGCRSYSEEDFRNDGAALEWIESLVRKELAALEQQSTRDSAHNPEQQGEKP